MKLTSLLHWLPDTTRVTQNELQEIYKGLFSCEALMEVPDEPVVDVIKREADNCLAGGPGINLEHKIVLSIAIRLLAEKFMIDKINDAAAVSAITKNQTHELVKELERRFPAETALIVLKKVLIMTPENIHLNAFAYEPIVDMSDDHLKKLYQEVKKLK
jgi:hypothetical protein